MLVMLDTDGCEQPHFENTEMSLVDEVPSYYWNGDMLIFPRDQEYDELAMPVLVISLKRLDFSKAPVNNV